MEYEKKDDSIYAICHLKMDEFTHNIFILITSLWMHALKSKLNKIITLTCNSDDKNVRTFMNRYRKKL